MRRAKLSTRWPTCWDCRFPAGRHCPGLPPKATQRRIVFPRAFLNDEQRLDFSFSGLKTAVRYEIAGPGRPDFSAVDLAPERIADLAASFQEAVVDCLVGKSSLAVRKTGLQRLCVGGGVAANRRLRDRLQETADREGFELLIAPMALCTDNAVMGAIAIERWKAGLIESLDLDVYPGLIRH
jgi:N6-L-threonylcarbamoyladenine synthase